MSLWISPASFNFKVRRCGLARTLQFRLRFWFLAFESVFSSLQPLASSLQVSGGLTAGVTPVPIPNTAVKLRRADDTALVTTRERRSPPGFFFSQGLRAFRSEPFLFSQWVCRIRR